MSVALCSTIFPAVLPYVREWYASVLAQTEADFTVVLALDGVSPTDVDAAADAAVDFEPVQAEPGDPPARVRQRAWERVVQRFDTVVLVDADDVLHPTRVEAAVCALERADVYGCSLGLIDEHGGDLGKVFKHDKATATTDTDWLTLLALHNVFGLSNTAYRTSTLADTLPIPGNAVAVDWYVATRACWAGAAFVFDPLPRMSYRQYGNNIGRVLAPFDGAYLTQATNVVLRHHGNLLHVPGALPQAVLSSRRRLEEVTVFAHTMQDTDRRTSYLDAINLPKKDVYLWWEIVAMPELEMLWKP